MQRSIFCLLPFISSVCLAQTSQPTSGPAGRSVNTPAAIGEVLVSLNAGRADEALGQVSGGSQELKLARGIARAMHGLERFGQGLYRYGAGNTSPQRRMLGQVTGAAFPVPLNAKPDEVTYDKLRDLLEQLVKDLDDADKLLAEVHDSDAKLPVRVAEAWFDLNENGKRDSGEEFLAILTSMMGGPPDGADDLAKLEIDFDLADAFWFRGYCNILAGTTEFLLGYDFHEWFDIAGHLMFPGYVSAARKSLGERGISTEPFDMDSIADLIASIHTLRFPVKDGARLKSALSHFERAIARSRGMWDSALKETDDEHEWIPNPRQHSNYGNVRVTDEMVKSWRGILDECEAILQGKKLLPHWRLRRTEYGVNLRRVFTEPTTLDFVMWVEGTAATPYIERGPTTSEETWNSLSRAFGGSLLGYTFWFN